MKKIFTLFFALTTLYFVSFGQVDVDNGGFENWTSFSGYEDPTGWDSPNFEAAYASSFVVSKSTDAYEGTFSVKLESKTVIMFVVPGVIVNGDFSYNISAGTADVSGGDPYTQRPEKLTGWYKYTPASGDSCTIVAGLMKRIDGITRDTVGSAVFSAKTAVSTWTYFEVPFDYNSLDNPDSILIAATSTDYTNAMAGSTLYLDKLQLAGGTVGVQDVFEMLDASVYPNPAANDLYIDLKSGQDARVKIINVIGKEVIKKEIEIGIRTKIDISKLPQGVYFIEVESSTEKFTQKIIKN
ncbi:MAG: hypothetical protein A2W91_03195 [Bacteroidetes bacterium GWF2_38_335]|nr:MAG: hypothetical protein A2W91_03195 [Bacteroidetes bacterium GWF2_38_335]OFY77504.1 MAG: hypothetical protein A2281_01565 [Bacteroidetes bacterium RIFOXYA12_FULL_38_20]HBS87200.1 hypothetical protein [Bacteroidales bacterium]